MIIFVAPTASAPDQESVGDVYVAPFVASLLYVASSRTLARLSENVAGFPAVYARAPVLVTVRVYDTVPPGVVVVADALLVTVYD